MRIAAADPDLLPLLRQTCGLLVGAIQHVTVLYLDGRKIFAEPIEILQFAPSGDAGENVIDAEEEPALGQVHQ